MTIAITAIAPLILLAVLTEAITEQIKELLTDPAPRTKQLISMGVGLALAALLQVSLFSDTAGTIHVAGIILAGLLCSRGSNYIHDLYGMIAATKSNLQY